MTVKELKELLNAADDDAVVVLYDGYDEGDVYCTTAVQVAKENYTAYCQDRTCVEDGEINNLGTDCPDNKLFVLAGWGSPYDELDEVKNADIHLISSGPEAEPSRIAAKKRHEEAERKAQILAEEREARKKEELIERRHPRYLLDFYDGGLKEMYIDTIEEAKEIIGKLGNCEYAVYDRVDGTKIMEGSTYASR